MAVRTATWLGGLMATGAAGVGLVLLLLGFNNSHSCTLFPTSSRCHSATPFEVFGVILLVLGILGIIGAVRAGGRR